MIPVVSATPRPKVWARSEYERLVEAGILGPEDRLELLEGEIIQFGPEKSRHGYSTRLIVGREGTVAPVAAPQSMIPIAALLP